MKRALYGILLTSAAVLAGCSGNDPGDPPEAAGPALTPRSYELPYRGSVTLQLPEEWQEEIRRAPGGLATTVEYRPATGDAFRMAINLRWSLAGDPTFNSTEQVDRFARENLDLLKGSYLEEGVALEPLTGPQAAGALFRMTHTGEHLMDGRFTRRVQAVLAVDDLLVGAVLIAEAADPELEQRFIELLAGIARLRPSGLDTRTAAPTLENGTLSNPGAGYFIDVPPGWTLRSVSNTQLMMLDRSDGPATFSILLKPAVGEVAEEFELLAQGMRSRPGVEIVDQRGHTVGTLSAIRMESRATVDGASFSTRNYVTVFAGAAYFMGVETADGVRDEVFDEVETMVASMTFGLESPAP